jgi:NTP pyrophosphatase (non-canonical NTP hydrolase)
MDTAEDQRRSWDLVPDNKKKRAKIANKTAIQSNGYSKNELKNMKDRLLLQGGVRQAIGDISFVSAYQQWASSMWNYHVRRKRQWTLRDEFIMSVGLGGETGEVLELLKKLERDHQRNDTKLHAEFLQNLEKELGDVLYYLTMIASRHDIPLDSIIRVNVQKLEERMQRKMKKKKHTRNCICPEC